MAVTWRCYIVAFIGLFCSARFQEADPISYRVSANPTTETCYTAGCVALALKMKSKMNFSADPCEDFNEFACGSFNRESVIPDGSSSVSAFSIVRDQNNLILKDIIDQETTSTQPQYHSNIKRFYKSCIDEAQIEGVGLAPYLNERAFVDDWPTLNPHWTGANFDFNEVVARYLSVYIDPVFSVSVRNVLADTSKNVIYLGDGSLGVKMEYYSGSRNHAAVHAYEKYLAETAVALNAIREVAEQDAREVADFEFELVKIMVPREKRRDLEKQFNPVKLNELSSLYSELDIAGAIRAAFSTANITLADDERIINRFPEYIGNISSVVTRFSKRTLQNVFGFKYALTRVVGLTRRMREIRLDFDKVLTGVVAGKPRWQVCVDETSKNFQQGMGKYFVNRIFSDNAKRKVNEMIDNLMAEFKKTIEHTKWLSQATKTDAIKMLAAITRKTGYPDADFEEADIEKFYENYTMKGDDYYNNRVLLKKVTTLDFITSLRKPVDRNKWVVAPYDVNAHYVGLQHEIVFLAGILQPPFFSESLPDYMNYGAIGSVIGHEIIHGFDDQAVGIQNDENGTLRIWWMPKDLQNFKNRTQCIVDQNSDVYVDEVNMTLNGIKTQRESTADYGGLEHSYKAYITHIRRFGREFSLPRLQLSQRKLFFLAFAQMYCAKVTPKLLRNQVTTDKHPPWKYRIIGALRNSKTFAKAYNCPRGSYMNPVEKCSVW